MTDKVELQNALNDLWQRYGDMLQELNTSLNTIDKLNKDVKRLKNTKPTIVTREVEVEKIIEKIVEVEVPVEIEKETIRVVEKEVPGPERIVEVEVPGPERIVEVPGPERVIEKIIEVPVTEFVDTEPKVVEKEASGDLKEAARLMAMSEFNKEDLSEHEIFDLLTKSSEDEVKKKIGFWATPLPTDADNRSNTKRYIGKK
jgi:hypothetical protein|tara:strand:+ start:623 stop:1225 length:603 start_codon:yes stop_codon:yes gene_type:complete